MKVTEKIIDKYLKGFSNYKSTIRMREYIKAELLVGNLQVIDRMTSWNHFTYDSKLVK